jgi:tight adherence protein B
VIIFIISISVIELLLYVIRKARHPNRERVKKRLKKTLSGKEQKETADILRRRVLSEVPTFHQILSQINGVERLDRLLQQANVKYPIGVFVLLSTLLGIIGFIAGVGMTKNYLISVIIMFCFIGLPFFYLRIKKKSRVEKFQKQLPDGLELMARALKAGHAFTSGMKLAADEFDDPLGPEFENTIDMINFGVSVPDALKKMASRIDCPELKYFVVSVILQKETGGNLAEIIESLAELIRKRFKLQDKVKTLAAEGKLSAIILIALPVCVVIFLRFSNPDYINTLVVDPIGRIVAGVCVLLMGIGVIIIKKMVNIKV